MLFWGNSLAFDNDWRIEGTVSVNCAIQGLTARAATDRTSDLPDMTFSAIVIAFGTVELVQNIDAPDAFQTDVNQITLTIRDKYPDARLIVLGIPHNSSFSDIWTYQQQPHLGRLNDSLKNIEAAAFIDTRHWLEALPPEDHTYDGVHFSLASYSLLEYAIWNTLYE